MYKLIPYKKEILIGLGAILLLLGLWWVVSDHYIDVGKAEVQAKWDADKAAQKKAEDAAIAKREADNKIEKAKQDKINLSITGKYNAELNQVRDALANAKRLRIGTAICGPRPAPTSQAEGPKGSAPADNASWGIREDAERDIGALELKVEKSFAAGRACQAFIREQGFAEE